MESSIRETTEQVDTIIDLDRQEILSILRDVQEFSRPTEYTVDALTDPYTDRHFS